MLLLGTLDGGGRGDFCLGQSRVAELLGAWSQVAADVEVGSRVRRALLVVDARGRTCLRVKEESRAGQGECVLGAGRGLPSLTAEGQAGPAGVQLGQALGRA